MNRKATTKKELLAIIMCLKEYRSMLLGGHINIYTDHNNLIFRTLSAQRVLSWKLYLEEYDINLTHIEGKSNVLADTFSRLPPMEKPTVGKKEASRAGKEFDFRIIEVPHDEEDVSSTTTTATMSSLNYYLRCVGTRIQKYWIAF